MIASIEQRFVLRIMSGTVSIGTHFLQLLDPPPLQIIRQRIPQTGEILMVACSHDFKRLSIEVKTAIRAKLYRPNPNVCADFIEPMRVLFNDTDDLVEVR